MVARPSLLVFVSLAALAGCDAGSGGGAMAEDERGSVGPASPAAVYCEKIGYKAEGESCFFPDGTSCEQWSFYRATCGQQHSYCSRRGGIIASREADAGDGFTVVNAVCTVNGKECSEEDFYRTGACN